MEDFTNEKTTAASAFGNLGIDRIQISSRSYRVCLWVLELLRYFIIKI